MPKREFNRVGCTILYRYVSSTKIIRPLKNRKIAKKDN